MKKFLALALLTTAFSAPSFAAEHEGWVYNGLTGMGYGSVDVGSVSFSDNAFTSNSNIGYRWGVVGVELGYTTVGNFKSDSGEIHADSGGWNLGVNVNNDISDKWSMQGRAGVFGWDVELKNQGAALPGFPADAKFSNSGTDFYAGVSIDYTWKQKASVGLGYTYYRAGDVDFSLWGMHSEYRF